MRYLTYTNTYQYQIIPDRALSISSSLLSTPARNQMRRNAKFSEPHNKLRPPSGSSHAASYGKLINTKGTQPLKITAVRGAFQRVQHGCEHQMCQHQPCKTSIWMLGVWLQVSPRLPLTGLEHMFCSKLMDVASS